MAFHTIEELAEHFERKTSLLKISLQLRNMDHSAYKALVSLYEDVEELQNTLEVMQKEVEKGNESLSQLANLKTRIETINHRVNHANQHIPVVVKNKSQKEIVNGEKANFCILQPQIAKTGKQTLKVGSKKVKLHPKMVPYLTVPEFDSIPKYMKGRLLYDKLNQFVDAFNKAITAKYIFLSTPLNQLGDAEFKRYHQVKRQDNKETEGLFFCTMEDLKLYGKVKGDNNTKSMIIILRHCTRIKEIRGPGALVRYAVAA